MLNQESEINGEHMHTSISRANYQKYKISFWNWINKNTTDLYAFLALRDLEKLNGSIKYLIIVIKFAENVDENYQINSKRERKIANNNVATNLKGIKAFGRIQSKSYRLARKIKARWIFMCDHA